MNLTLRVMIDGREHFAAPYFPEDAPEVARALDRQLPALRELGRVAIYVQHENVSHLIVAR